MPNTALGGDMTPRLAPNDVTDRAHSEAVALCQRDEARSVGPVGSNPPDVVFGQAGSAPSSRHRRDLNVQVAPGLASDGEGERGPLDPEASRDGVVPLPGTRPASSLQNDGVGEHGEVVALSALVALASCSASLRLVGAVRGMAAVVEVAGTTARRVVAGVAGQHRHDASGQVQRHSRRGMGSIPDLARSRPLELAIPLWVACSLPLPARDVVVNDVDLRPEPGFQRRGVRPGSQLGFIHARQFRVERPI